MIDPASSVIRIAAALIDDGAGRLLLVRKAGTTMFMQAGGKIKAGENARTALARELAEEIGLVLAPGAAAHLGRFAAPAANEAGLTVEAELFHVRTDHRPVIAGEIAEAGWFRPRRAAGLKLAPLTRHHVLPLARLLRCPRQGLRRGGAGAHGRPCR